MYVINHSTACLLVEETLVQSVVKTGLKEPRYGILLGLEKMWQLWSCWPFPVPGGLLLEGSCLLLAEELEGRAGGSST